jgi:hypothetical protein
MACKHHPNRTHPQSCTPHARVCTMERAPGATQQKNPCTTPPPEPTPPARRDPAAASGSPGPAARRGSERRSSACVAASTNAPAPGRARLTETFGAMPDSDPPARPRARQLDRAAPGLACRPAQFRPRHHRPPAHGGLSGRREARWLGSRRRRHCCCPIATGERRRHVRTVPGLGGWLLIMVGGLGRWATALYYAGSLR